MSKEDIENLKSSAPRINLLSDNFDGSIVNEKIWNIANWNGYIYENVTIESGKLKEIFHGPNILAGIFSKNKYRYNTYTARIKLPNEQPVFIGAFWLMRKELPLYEEIDIEYFGNDTNALYLSVFNGWDYINDKPILRAQKRVIFSYSPAADFHIYQIRRSHICLEYYMDGQKLWRYRGGYIPTHEMELWISGGHAYWLSDPMTTGIMLTDYVNIK